MNSNTHKLTKTTLALSLFFTCLTHYSYAAETNIVINTSKQKFIGENSVLDRKKFFNLHSIPTSSEYTPADIQLITEELNAGFGRSFWSPMAASGDTLYPSTEFAQTQGAINVTNQKNNVLYPYLDRRVVVTDHPAAVMKVGNDPIDGARWAADYFENYYDNDTRPLFYEPMNEPFVHASDFVEGGWDPVQNLIVQDKMTEWFKEIGLEFDRRGINTKVIGYSSAWPSMELNDFSHWEERQKRFMDIAGEAVDAFSFHLYDGVNVTGQDNIRSGSNAEAIMDLIETYSHYKWDTVKPHALTEYGGIINGYEGVDYSPERSSQELRALNHILFSALAREDRILTSIPFISGKAAWFYQANNFQPYSAALFRPDPTKIVGNKVNGFLLTEKAKFFQLWENVKGKRIDIQEQDPDLASQAFVYGPKVYIALNNLEDKTKSVALNFVNSLDNLEQVRIKRLNIPYGEAAIYSDETSSQAPNELTLAAHETVVLEYQFTTTITQNSVLQTHVYYSDTHLQPILANRPISFEINQVALNANPESFTDFIANQFEYDPVLAQAINPNTHNALTRIIQNLNRSFALIIAKNPDNWQQDKRLAILIKNATQNKNINLALQHHFYSNGFNSNEGMSLLRMGIGRKHDKSKQPTLLVNGFTVAVPNDWAGYDQAARSDFFGSIEIPVPTRYLKQNNQITATFPDSEGRVSTMILEVNNNQAMQTVAVTGIELNHPEFENGLLQINKDKTRRLKAHVLPYNATEQYIIWHSSDNAIVSVNNDGILTPHQPGTATLTATTLDGDFNQTVEINVLDQISLANTVTIIEDTSDEISSDSYSIKIAYSTNQDRDLTLEMRSPTNQWLGETRITVPAGEGEAEMIFNTNEALPAASGYRWTAGLRTIGGNWQTNVDSHSINGIVIHPQDWQYTDDSSVEIIADTSNLKVSPSYKITVQYTAVVESDVTFDINHTSGWIGGTRTTVQPGTGQVDLTVWPAHPIAADDGYRFNVAIREKGGNWQTDYANTVINNITIQSESLPEEPDHNLLTDFNPDFESGALFPWTTSWDMAGTAQVSSNAAFTGQYGLQVDTNNGKVGFLLDKNILPQTIFAAGKQLRLSMDIKRDSTDGWVGGFAQFWNNASGWVGSPQKFFEIKNNWQRVEVIIDGQDFAEGSTRFQLNFNKTGELIYIDNIKLEVVSP